MRIANCLKSWLPCFLTVVLPVTNSLFAAQTDTPAPRRTGPSPLVSPEVNANRMVTFRLRAPAAKAISVSGEWPNGNAAMTRNADGLWSVTAGPLAPDLYGYSFLVDGLRVLDPANAKVKPMRSPTTSILDVPGDRPLLHDFQNVPHGTVRLHSYYSKPLEKLRELRVYTPPSYDQKRSARYPTLYLFHGSGDNESTWTVLGRAQWITDNLLAQGKIKPMVIVMLDGHATLPQTASPTPEGRSRNIEAFQRDLLEVVMPLVEANYRVKKTAADRAIIGLSMGGGQSLFIGLTHLDQFSWVGGMSSSVNNPETTLAKTFGNPKTTNAKLRLLWFACGKDDFLLKANQQLDELLAQHQIRHTFALTEGNHSWPVWRRYLAEFLPLIFQN